MDNILRETAISFQPPGHVGWKENAFREDCASSPDNSSGNHANIHLKNFGVPREK